MNVVVVGHVDHGKSTLIGRLLYDSESLPEERLAEVQKLLEDYKERFEFAHFLDSFQEELEEERTIDTTRVIFKGRDYYTVVDVPGHKEFIKNMLTGACQAESAILVVSAPDGVEEQTGRHSFLIRMLGIKKVIVGINKMDAVDFSEDIYHAVTGDAGRLLASLGYADPEFIPISSLDGDNVYKASENMPWYHGPTIIQALDAIVPETKEPKSLRFVVQDVYRNGGPPITVGRVEAGTLEKGDRLVFQPSGVTGTVDKILVFPGEVATAQLDDCPGLEMSTEPSRGDVGSRIDSRPKVVESFIGQVVILEGALRVGDETEIKCGTKRARGVIREIREKIDSETGTVVEQDPAQLDEHDAGIVVFDTEPLVVEKFSDIPQLGRFILVNKGRNTGAGLVIGEVDGG